MSYPSLNTTYLIGQESAWGTGVTADKDVGIITEVSENPTRENIVTEGINNIEAIDNKSGVQTASHTVSMDYQHGRIFEYVAGSVAHDETTGDWVHTFTVSNSPPSFTAEISNNGTSDTANTYTGCLIESCEISIALNENLKVNYTASGKFPTNGTSGSAAVVDTLATFPHSLVSLSINSGAISEVQSFNISISKAVNFADGISSNDHQQGHNTTLRVEFSGTIGFEDNTYDAFLVNNNVTSINLVADNGVSLGSGKVGMDLDLDTVNITGATKTASVGNLVFYEISGTAKINTWTSTDDISSTNW